MSEYDFGVIRIGPDTVLEEVYICGLCGAMVLDAEGKRRHRVYHSGHPRTVPTWAVEE